MTITAPLAIEIVSITPANLKQLQSINISTLPVRYTDKFYNDLLLQYNNDYLKFAVWNGFNIAAVCARVEKIDDNINNGYNKLYIMTINVLAPYRRRGIGQKLLDYVLDIASKDTSIIEAYLHVQTSNEDARQFYIRNGFEETGIVDNYYKRIEPPHAYFLKKKLRDPPVVDESSSSLTDGIVVVEEETIVASHDT